MGRATEGRGLQRSWPVTFPAAFLRPEFWPRRPHPPPHPPASFSGRILLCRVQDRPGPLLTRRMARPAPLPDSAEVKQKAS